MERSEEAFLHPHKRRLHIGKFLSCLRDLGTPAGGSLLPPPTKHSWPTRDAIKPSEDFQRRNTGVPNGFPRTHFAVRRMLASEKKQEKSGPPRRTPQSTPEGEKRRANESGRSIKPWSSKTKKHTLDEEKKPGRAKQYPEKRSRQKTNKKKHSKSRIRLRRSEKPVQPMVLLFQKTCSGKNLWRGFLGEGAKVESWVGLAKFQMSAENISGSAAESWGSWVVGWVGAGWKWSGEEAQGRREEGVGRRRRGGGSGSGVAGGWLAGRGGWWWWCRLWRAHECLSRRAPACSDFNGKPWLKASEALSCSDRSLVSDKLINQPLCKEKGEVAGQPPPSDAQIPVAPTFSNA